MRLRDKKIDAATEDRAELTERVAAGASPGQKLIGIVTSFAAVGVILGGLGYKFWYLPAHQPAMTTMQTQQKDTSAPQSPSLHLPAFAPAPTADAAATPPLPPGMAGAPGGTAPGPAAGGQSGNAQAGAQPQPTQQEQEAANARKAVLARKLSGDMGAMPGQSESGVMPLAAAHPGAAATPVSLGVGAAGQAGNDFSAKLIPTSTPKVAATYIPNPSFTIIKGTPIRCTLDTAMNSDTPGFVSCTVSKPVYGMDGKVVLIDRGSTIDGELAKGPERGKKRAAVLWGRIVTPYNVAIQVNSPGTDTLGAAGLTGSIDNHYCERFCGAFLFSSLEDLLQAGVQAAGSQSGGNTNIVLPQNTMSSGQSAAGEILNQGRDVQPTFSKNQGDEISITVARDLDFTTAYHLEATQP